MIMITIAFLLLRVTIACLFLAPLKKFLTHWKFTVNMVGTVLPFHPFFSAMVMIGVMFFGAIFILLGFYAQIAAIFLAAFCLIGAYAHRVYVKQLQAMHLEAQASPADQKILNDAKRLGIVGNVTSGQKNIVIAVVLIFIFLVGSGPYSVTGDLF